MSKPCSQWKAPRQKQSVPILPQHLPVRPFLLQIFWLKFLKYWMSNFDFPSILCNLKYFGSISIFCCCWCLPHPFPPKIFCLNLSTKHWYKRSNLANWKDALLHVALGCCSFHFLERESRLEIRERDMQPLKYSGKAECGSFFWDQYCLLPLSNLHSGHIGHPAPQQREICSPWNILAQYSVALFLGSIPLRLSNVHSGHIGRGNGLKYSGTDHDNSVQ